MGDIADEIIERKLFGRPKRRYTKVWDTEFHRTEDQLRDETRSAAERALEDELDEDAEMDLLNGVDSTNG